MEEALKAQPTTAKSSQTVLDTEKVDNQSAKTAIYGFLKELYGDFMPEEHVNHVSKEQVESLFEQGNSTLRANPRRRNQTILGRRSRKSESCYKQG